jgi:hypothetical protein
MRRILYVLGLVSVLGTVPATAGPNTYARLVQNRRPRL